MADTAEAFTKRAAVPDNVAQDEAFSPPMTPSREGKTFGESRGGEGVEEDVLLTVFRFLLPSSFALALGFPSSSPRPSRFSFP